MAMETYRESKECGSVQILNLKRTGFKEFSGLLWDFVSFSLVLSFALGTYVFLSTFQAFCPMDFSQKMI